MLRVEAGDKVGARSDPLLRHKQFPFVRIMEMVEIEAGPFLQKTSFGDYRAFGGFQFPTRQDWQSEWGAGGIRIGSIEVNKVKPSAFEPPTELQPGNSARMTQLGKR